MLKRPHLRVLLIAAASFVLGIGAAATAFLTMNSDSSGSTPCGTAGVSCSVRAAEPTDAPTSWPTAKPTDLPPTASAALPAATALPTPEPANPASEGAVSAPDPARQPDPPRAPAPGDPAAPAPEAASGDIAHDDGTQAMDGMTDSHGAASGGTTPIPGGAHVSESGGSGTGCVANCGEPRNFCDNWSGGFCDDFRDKASGATHTAFPAPGDPYSFDALNTTYPFADTEGPEPADGLRAFSANEHFMTVIEDGQFGLGVLRLHQPFDFSGREGHMHFDVDLKTGARRYVRLLVSPELTKVTTDDRHQERRRPGDAFDLWFVNGRFDAQVSRGGDLVWEDEPLGPTYFGQNDVRDHVDVYLSRTHIRVLVNGASYLDESMADLGFDRAYVYLAQASYNPCKTDECDAHQQMFHWDNVAFDGPRLGMNSLTPAGSRDVLFDAYRANSCTVKGAAAEAVGPDASGSRVTWRVRLPDDGSSVSPADVSCDYDFIKDDSDVITGFEIVSQ